MLTKDDFQFGDVIACHGDKWLSKGIQLFMKVYTEKILHKEYEIMFNHIAVIINDCDEKWVVEALAWGPRIYPIEQSGYLNNKNIILLRDRRGFSVNQIKAMSQKVKSLGGVRYQYEAFIQYICKIGLRLNNMFRKENEKAVNCSELGAIFINAAYPDTFPRPNETSPMDHVLSPTYEVVDINGVM